MMKSFALSELKPSRHSENSKEDLSPASIFFINVFLEQEASSTTAAAIQILMNKVMSVCGKELKFRCSVVVTQLGFS